jgi:hypothetical protein
MEVLSAIGIKYTEKNINAEDGKPLLEIHFEATLLEVSCKKFITKLK